MPGRYKRGLGARVTSWNEEVTMSYYWNVFVARPARNIYWRMSHL